MKFKDKYPYADIDDEVRICVFRNPIEGKCSICQETTDFVEINYVAFYCSEECLAEEDRRYNESLQYTIGIDFAKGEENQLAVKRIDIKEFRELGFLQEANRLFFHPLGLALEVSVNEDGSEFISGVWDSRDDDEGIAYHDSLLMEEVAKTKANNVRQLREKKAVTRKRELGYITQPIK